MFHIKLLALLFKISIFLPKNFSYVKII